MKEVELIRTRRQSRQTRRHPQLPDASGQDGLRVNSLQGERPLERAEVDRTDRWGAIRDASYISPATAHVAWRGRAACAIYLYVRKQDTRRTAKGTFLEASAYTDLYGRTHSGARRDDREAPAGRSSTAQVQQVARRTPSQAICGARRDFASS